MQAFANGPRGQSPPSPAVSFQTLKETPSAPDPLRASNIKETTALVTWKKVEHAVSYTLEIKEAASPKWLSPGAPLKTTSQQLNGLQPATAYQIRVSANGPGGKSPASQVADFTTKNEPHECVPPNGITAILMIGAEEMPTSGTVSWKAVAGAVSYKIEVFRHNEDDWWVAADGIKEARHVLRNVRGLTDSRVRISTNCADGKSPPSEPVSFERPRRDEPPVDVLKTQLDDAIKKLLESQNMTPQQTAMVARLRGLLQRLELANDPRQRALLEVMIRAALPRAETKPPRPNPVAPTPPEPKR